MVVEVGQGEQKADNINIENCSVVFVFACPELIILVFSSTRTNSYNSGKTLGVIIPSSTAA